MNDDANLYANSNCYQKNTIKKVIEEFAPLLQWREDGCDSVLDIGCGTGNVTIDLILPLLPPNFRHLIACDLSDNMIQYAQQHYIRPKVTFEMLDIREHVDKLLTKFGPFDHIVSFFCLHWVQNQKKVFKDIGKLLTSNGDCLLTFLTSSNTFAVYDEMSKTPKWSKYLKDVEQYVPAHQYVTNPADDFQLLCQHAGFNTIHITTQEPIYVCESYTEFKNFYTSVNPFVKRIRANDQESFITEVVGRLMAKLKEQNHEIKYLVKCKIITIYAKK